MDAGGPLPAVVKIAVEKLQSRGDPSIADASLWLEASWRYAQHEGIDGEEFSHWVEVGVWNLAGKSEVLEKIGIYRKIAGNRGWILAKANLSPREALARSLESSGEDVVEAAEVMVGLSAMSKDDSEEPSRSSSPPGWTTPKDPINFG